MMKDSKNEPMIQERIKKLSPMQFKQCLDDKKDDLYFYAPNAFINVIDIVREQVIA